MQKKVKTKKQKELFWGWLFLFPTMLGLIVLNIIPMFQSLYESFFKTGAFGKGNVFVGFENYEKMLQDEQVWQAVGNTFKYAILEVPLSIVIALIVAVLLNQKLKGTTFFRTIFFIPMVAAPAAVAMVWRWLYNTEFGLFNQIISGLGFDKISFISNPDISIFSVAFVGIWSVIGYNMILFLAGLQEIPHDYYEAANIDGASPIHQFFHITIPLITPTMFFVTVTRIIAAMQVFDVILLMMDATNPALKSTQSLVYLFYRYSFVENNKGYGSAIVMLLLVIILLITAVQMAMQKRWVNYN